MLNALIKFSIRNPFLIVLAAIAIAITGVFSAERLPIDAIPDLTNVQVQVIAEAPGFSALEVESMLSFPIESAMGGIPGVEQVRSVSKFGISVVTIVFKDGTDLARARQWVSERLPTAAAAIPSGVGAPKLGPLATALSEIYQFQVKGDGVSALELRTYLDWFLAQQIRTVPGVTEVNAHGGSLKTYQIAVDPERLASYRLSLTEVVQAIESNNSNVGGGYLVNDGEARYIRGESQVRKFEEIEEIVIDERDGVPVRIGDIAKVVPAPMIRSGLATRDGQGEAVVGLVMMMIGENSHQVAKRVKAEIERLKASLPVGMTIEPLYDRTELVEQTLGTVEHNLLLGGVFVVAVLLILLGDLIGGILVALVIPLSMLFAINLMVGWGVAASLMSLGAIDFGLIVDSSVIMIENCSRRLGLESGTRPKIDIIRDAAIEVRKPTMFGELIIAVVFLPILTLEGTEGKLFRPMALTLIFALMGSMLMSITLMPALASILLRSKKARVNTPQHANDNHGHGHDDVWLIKWIKFAYQPVLKAAISQPFVTAGATIGLTIAGAVMAFGLGGEFMPKLNEGDLLVEAVRIPSASLDDAVSMSTKIENVLKTFPEVKTVFCKTGRPEIANDVMGVHQTDVWIMLKPQEEWRPGIDRETLKEDIQKALTERVPGVAFGISQPIEMRVNELVAGVKSDVAALLYGPDLAVLQAKAKEIEQVLSKIPGARDLKSPSIGLLPMLRIIVKRDQLARYGIKASEVLNVIQSLGGKTIGWVVEGQARHPIQVRLPEEYRNDPKKIQSVRVIDHQGRPIPLSELVEIKMEEGPSEIERENVSRRAVIGVNVRGRDMTSFVAEAEKTVRERVSLPPGYLVRWGGQFEHFQSASKRLMIVTPIALGLIFLLLYWSTQCWRMTALIALLLPAATAGGVFALIGRDMPFSISAGIGFIALFGVSVLNGLVWVNGVENARGEWLQPKIAAERTSLTRLRPILMTALTGGLGFLPMAIATSPGSEIQRPLATVVIGGLITSTLMTTLVLPAIYPWFVPSRKTPS